MVMDSVLKLENNDVSLLENDIPLWDFQVNKARKNKIVKILKKKKENKRFMRKDRPVSGFNVCLVHFFFLLIAKASPFYGAFFHLLIPVIGFKIVFVFGFVYHIF